MPNLGAFCTPDGLWYAKWTKFYPSVGGPAQREPIGAYALNILMEKSGPSWSVGAKYTPDEIWWNSNQTSYAQHGGHANQELRCGYSFLILHRTPGHHYGDIGAHQMGSGVTTGNVIMFLQVLPHFM